MLFDTAIFISTLSLRHTALIPIYFSFLWSSSNTHQIDTVPAPLIIRQVMTKMRSIHRYSLSIAKTTNIIPNNLFITE